MADTRKRITGIQKQLTDLEGRISSLQQMTDTTDGRFQTIETRRTEATQLKNEIDTIKSEITTILADIQQKSTSATELEGSIEELVNGAEESKETFNTHSKSLEEIEEKIKKFELEITEQLGRAGSGALALAFSLRQGEIEKELKKWFGILSAITGALMFIGVCFFIYAFFVQVNLQFFLKLTISLPFIYAEWFASKQYNKERFILERYAFKAAQAKSLSAFSKTVKEMDETEAGQSTTQKFVINSIEKIYIAPKFEGNNSDDDFPIVKIAEKIADIVKVAIKLKP